MRRKRRKGHYYGSTVKSLFESINDPKELTKRDFNKQSNIDFKNTFNLSDESKGAYNFIFELNYFKFFFTLVFKNFQFRAINVMPFK